MKRRTAVYLLLGVQLLVTGYMGYRSVASALMLEYQGSLLTSKYPHDIEVEVWQFVLQAKHAAASFLPYAMANILLVVAILVVMRLVPKSASPVPPAAAP